MIKKTIYLVPLIAFMLTPGSLITAQSGALANPPKGVQAEVIFGFNFSQLSGDNLSGYRHMGLRAGTQVSMHWGSKLGLNIGMLYDEKGSSETFSLAPAKDDMTTKLRYLSVPVDLIWLTSYRKEINRYRLRYNIGIVGGRLFGATVANEVIARPLDQYNKYDIAANLGVTYHLSSVSGLHLRIEHSLTDLLQTDSATDVPQVLSYLLSLQYVYALH